MRLKEITDRDTAVLVLEGEIDLHYSPALRSLLQSKIKNHCPALILDLSDVIYIDSSGLAVIMEYMRDAATRGTVFCLAGLNKTIKTIFEIVGLDKTVPIFRSTRAAAAAVRANRVQPPAGLFNRSETDGE
ncbi:MAG: anti-sigma factor antagonist [Verrucomicrobiota bacterium]|jgi:anti-sigma B factor antagonist